jgi:hypothetical protein
MPRTGSSKSVPQSGAAIAHSAWRREIVFRNASVTNDDFDEKALIKQLYPDQETYKKQEQRRFEILDTHWDLPIEDVDLNA